MAPCGRTGSRPGRSRMAATAHEVARTPRNLVVRPRDFPMLRILFAITSFLVLALPATAAPKNVVLLIADDLGMQVGCYGDKAAKTPNIDKLAAAGTRFTHGFASVSSCSPSRATLLTGMPTHMCGQYGLAHADHNAATF